MEHMKGKFLVIYIFKDEKSKAAIKEKQSEISMCNLFYKHRYMYVPRRACLQAFPSSFAAPAYGLSSAQLHD
jgi:hypothetical protein